MVTIELLDATHLPQVTALVNLHLGALVSGWSVPEGYLAAIVERNPGEYVVDPWVIDRATLVALERRRVVAAAHVLRYGTSPEVNPPYRGVVEIDWLFALPDAVEATARLLAAVNEQATAWQATERWLAGGPPVGPFAGVPDVWPHLCAAIEAAGYRPDPGRVETVYGGALGQVPPAGDPPSKQLGIRRSTGHFGARFDAMDGERSVGYCDIITDLTEGGALPALRGWAELAEIEVEPGRRNQGLGTWLLRHAAAWARLGGCDRILFAVTAEDESAGAGRFYGRFGWQPLTRLRIGFGAR